MRIKKFNESKDKEITEVHIVIMHDSRRNIMEDECKCFYDKMKAANFIINEVNSEYDQNFERFYDNDGSRFFLTIDENPDWEECLCYLNENEIDIQIISLPIE
jgi:hypothetical protein